MKVRNFGKNFPQIVVMGFTVTIISRVFGDFCSAHL